MLKKTARSILAKILYYWQKPLINSFWEINNYITDGMINPELYDWSGEKINIYKVLANLEEPILEIRKFINLPIIQELQNCNSIQILQESFYDHEGKIYLSGGAERYLCDLAEIIIKLGYKPFIVQHGKHFWHLKHNNIDVFGVPANMSMPMLNILAHDKVFGQPKMRIYSHFTLAYPYTDHCSIGISHGIFWSYVQSRLLIPTIHKAYKSLTTFVSVDTATLAWLRCFLPEQVNAKKSIYLPNYVNLTEFIPIKKQDDGKIRIIYPRRIYAPRGYFIVDKVVPYILDKYPNVEFHFVGQADSPAKEAVELLTQKYKDKVFAYFQPAEKMHETYQMSDITIIPSIINEGTSLSCLEAMAAGNSIIATTVGGLTDLIINNFNGILIEANPPSLQEALERLITEPQIRKRLSGNALEVAKSFDKKQWINQWQSLLIETIEKSNRNK